MPTGGMSCIPTPYKCFVRITTHQSRLLGGSRTAPFKDVSQELSAGKCSSLEMENASWVLATRCLARWSRSTLIQSTPNKELVALFLRKGSPGREVGIKKQSVSMLRLTPGNFTKRQGLSKSSRR